MSGFLPGALLPSPSLYPSPLSSLSPPGSYRLAPNQLDAAPLGSPALARERRLRSWHCGKPKATKHAHDRHLVAVRVAHTGVPRTGWSPAGEWPRTPSIEGLNPCSPANPKSACLPTRHRLPPPTPHHAQERDLDGVTLCLSRIPREAGAQRNKGTFKSHTQGSRLVDSIPLWGARTEKKKILRGQHEILERGQPAMLPQRWCQKRLEGKEQEEGEPLRPCCWVVGWLVPVCISFCPAPCDWLSCG